MVLKVAVDCSLMAATATMLIMVVTIRATILTWTPANRSLPNAVRHTPCTSQFSLLAHKPWLLILPNVTDCFCLYMSTTKRHGFCTM